MQINLLLFSLIRIFVDDNGNKMNAYGFAYSGFYFFFYGKRTSGTVCESTN